MEALSDTIEGPKRLTLWATVFKKFFPWVWFSIVVLFFTGLYMMSQMGGLFGAGRYIYLMFGLAVVMTVIFKFVYLAPFRHLCRGVEEEKWEMAAFALGTIRKLVAVNLSIGILVIVSATALKFW